MAWPTGTQIRNLSISDPKQIVLGATWECISSGSNSSILKITFPWNETRIVTVKERVTTKWYNPYVPGEWLSFWAIGCSNSGTYGIANYKKELPLKILPEKIIPLAITDTTLITGDDTVTSRLKIPAIPTVTAISKIPSKILIGAIVVIGLIIFFIIKKK